MPFVFHKNNGHNYKQYIFFRYDNKIIFLMSFYFVNSEE